MERDSEVRYMDHREITTFGILGVLAEEESATIKDVRDALQHSFGNYWGASTGVIEPAMTGLETDGHVEVTLFDGVGAYRITESGRERLRSLLREPVDGLSSSPLQPQLVMKLGFLHHLPLTVQRDEVSALTDRLRTARADLVDVESLHETAVDEGTDTGYRGELIRLRIFVLDALLEWLDTVEINCAMTR